MNILGRFGERFFSKIIFPKIDRAISPSSDGIRERTGYLDVPTMSILSIPGVFGWFGS